MNIGNQEKKGMHNLQYSFTKTVHWLGKDLFNQCFTQHNILNVYMNATQLLTQPVEGCTPLPYLTQCLLG